MVTACFGLMQIMVKHSGGTLGFEILYVWDWFSVVVIAQVSLFVEGSLPPT